MLDRRFRLAATGVELVVQHQHPRALGEHERGRARRRSPVDERGCSVEPAAASVGFNARCANSPRRPPPPRARGRPLARRRRRPARGGHRAAPWGQRPPRVEEDAGGPGSRARGPGRARESYRRLVRCRSAVFDSPPRPTPGSRRRSPSFAASSRSWSASPTSSSPKRIERHGRWSSPTRTRPQSPSSRSTHRSRWTSIRRSTSSAAGRATACGTRSPTSRRSSRPGACSTRRRAAASRRSTPPMETHACIRPHSPRGLRASYRASSARRSSGRWRWTRPAKGPPSTSGRRASGAVRS